MLPMRCSQPPCRNSEVEDAGPGRHELQPARQLRLAEQHRGDDADGCRRCRPAPPRGSEALPQEDDGAGDNDRPDQDGRAPGRGVVEERDGEHAVSPQLGRPGSPALRAGWVTAIAERLHRRTSGKGSRHPASGGGVAAACCTCASGLHRSDDAAHAISDRPGAPPESSAAPLDEAGRRASSTACRRCATPGYLALPGSRLTRGRMTALHPARRARAGRSRRRRRAVSRCATSARTAACRCPAGRFRRARDECPLPRLALRCAAGTCTAIPSLATGQGLRGLARSGQVRIRRARSRQHLALLRRRSAGRARGPACHGRPDAALTALPRRCASAATSTTRSSP